MSKKKNDATPIDFQLAAFVDFAKHAYRQKDYLVHEGVVKLSQTIASDNIKPVLLELEPEHDLLKGLHDTHYMMRGMLATILLECGMVAEALAIFEASRKL